MKMTRYRRPPTQQQARQPRSAVQTLMQKYFAQDFFTYVIPITEPLNADTQTDANVNIEADSDFLCQKLTAMVLLDDDSVVPLDEAALTIVILDTGSGRNIMSSAVPLNGMFGTGQLPFILPTPKVYKASGQIQVTVFNVGAANYNAVYLNFIGQKCFLKASKM